eukprot:8413157-Ditylum_brightwellii.AAC.1
MAHLSLMTFLKHYCIYNNVTIQDDTCVHYKENKGILGRMHWYQIRAIQTPRECLAPDYDIQAQVEAVYKEMNINVPTKW